MDFKLKGKSVFVTGASKGIGKAIAEAFAAEGARVALTAANAVDEVRRRSRVLANALICLLRLQNDVN